MTKRRVRQRLNLNNGLIGEWMVMVNGRLWFSDTPTSHPTMSNYRIMKFSPHFDEMLACRYVFENEIGQWSYYADQQLITDTSGSRVFLLFNVDVPTELTEQSLAGSVDKFVRFNNMIQGVVVEYDSQLQPLEVYQIEQVQPQSGRAEWNSYFGKMVIDADSNLLFILGDIADNDPEIDLTVNGQAVEIGTRDAFFLKTLIGSPTILADGFARSDQFTSLLTSKDHKGAVASKGRLYAMMDYACNIQWRDTSIVLPRNQFGGCNEGEGVFVWSYEGEEIDFIDLKKSSMLNPVSSSLALRDSVLYVCGGLTEDVRIADTVIHPASYSIAYFAKYDFTNGSGGGTVSIPMEEEGVTFVVYPNPFRQRINIRGNNVFPITAAWLTDMMGRREEVRLTPEGPDQYTLDLTSYPQTVYLLVLTTADGHQHMVKLLRQP